MYYDREIVNWVIGVIREFLFCCYEYRVSVVCKDVWYRIVLKWVKDKFKEVWFVKGFRMFLRNFFIKF